MTLRIRAQAVSLLLGFVLGVGLGLFYDALRPIRRRSGDLVWDTLYCLFAAAAGFVFAMRAPDGVPGTGELLLTLFGLVLYFQLLSPVIFPIFGKIDGLIGVFWINTRKTGKNFLLFAKKLFQNLQE